MKKYLVLALLSLTTLFTQAQIVDPIQSSAQLKTGKTAEGEIVFNLDIEQGWHVYSVNLGSSGPIEASFHVNKMDGVEKVGGLVARGNEISKMDNLFGMKLRFFEHKAQFVQKIRFTKPNYTIDAYLEYGACNDETCMPPQEVTFKKAGKSPAVEAATTPQEPTEKEAKDEDSPSSLSPDSMQTAATDTLLPAPVDTNQVAVSTDLWQPVIQELQQQDGRSEQNGSLWFLFLMGFAGGLLALFTPCVWPIIPMTVSFFLKRTKDKAKGMRDAITYGLAIIVIFLSLGLLVTAFTDPHKLNELATSAVFNIFFFLLLVVFALSFFGWFELRLPESWGNKMDSKASSTTGLLSIFLMAFTLVLVSFSCTAPIVGFLLVQAATSGNWVGPAIGMFGFALALALPFTLFALFPSWLKQAPKSGSWMNTIKVVLGFIELAFALKFLSVADLAYGWHILDREVFLSLWIVIFGMLGLYLIGHLKFQSDMVGGESKPMPVVCIMLGMVSLAFTVYMVPGLWGAPVKAVSAFAPPINTQDFNLNNKEVHAAYTNYEEGMAAAKAQGKPAFIDFTGFGCVNCRKMEAAVWTDPSVAEVLTKDYVLISLFVDDKTPLKEQIEVMDNGKKRTLRTVGDKWSYLQSSKFGANTQPFYVPLDNAGKPLTGSYSYKEDVSAYLDFLKKGLEAYRNRD
ncbi:thiol:disulfide interchange protein [Hoylesella buccalis]|uniref:Thiol:disulfide interchange protein n=1 Tax=Hoylesella buccalis TaxID=28127 RepID=A0A2N6QTI8_9BACT|nr:cytochrome c biogenesis protein CcdA [Hoylesella buccalis]PMC25358.1 thiol:disulfide interchange protein [Hoylesella buccalis]